ncbi:hypothetical protein COV24_00700 [candidate division WWE3 bacterium CG10_big_fil_rev_8_21_14_0_10_32_10]|uniref:Glycosyltransferase RgtA/B/C/D-like domain-containing protein n=1 Tax=candidate division WWE3 bacterium CG10_big_fil_rev_8_21_14_0_10_32_10 TaxID=1975090 RepID=A0A2H0RBI5_UNCKA|nr:MAG: hypothetical protein COV24_00700 [candidate division WWE3 bacterium CG10_big_fil_rev_8_21_14_0_10_32_10]
MGINSKIAKIPFFVLYLIIATLVSLNWIKVIIFQKDFENFRSTQPWDYYISSFAVQTLGVTHQQYFLFALPLILLGLYGLFKILGNLLDKDKKTNINGGNHIAIIALLLVLPGVLNISKYVDMGKQTHLLIGIILVFLFSVWSWMDEKIYKSK